MKGNEMEKNGGKLIVITGPDGCGKKTQTSLLVDKFKKCGYDTESIDFPRYEKNFFGKMVGRYLKGEFGKATEVSPYLASILYAGDRFESMRQINQWLTKGKLVVCDRYVGDNFLHQGSKIADSSEREKFFDWLEDLEFNVFDAKYLDITIYLDVSLEISLALLKNKDAQEKKNYTDGKNDGHENEVHLRQVRETSKELIKKFGWIKIDCMKNGELMSPEEISDSIWKFLNSKPRPF